MNLSMIAPPLIGSVIGYATNYIAVKMLFRPMKPVIVFGHTLPFTPGIIPKGKPRLAKAVGDVVSNSLLSTDILKETLLSDEIKEKLSDNVHQYLLSLKEDERSVDAFITTYIEKESLEQYKFTFVDYVANRIDHQLKEKPVGEFIASEVIRTVKENLKGGLLGLMATDSLLNPIGVKIQEGIDEYLAQNALGLVVPVITEECDKALNYPLTSIGERLSSNEEAITKGVLRVYEQLIENRLSPIIQSINIASIIENRINEMEVKELEELIFQVMKKELNAIVNLGAVIGFILGLFNLFF